jgi:hypothetical protein
MGTVKTDKEGNKEIDFEKRIKSKLKAAAIYAVENVEITTKEFKGMAGEVFEAALEKQEAKESGEETSEDEKEPEEGELVGAGVEE